MKNHSENQEKNGNIGLVDHFSIPVYSLDIKDFTQHQQALIDYCLSLKKVNPGLDRSNVNGWHSKDDLFTDNNPHIKWMVKKITNIAQTAAGHFHGEQRQGKPEIKALWANVNDSGAWNAPHQHLPADWSGVLYLSAESNEKPTTSGITNGDLLFFNPMPMGPRFDRPATISYRPVNGRILIFPAYAMHMVAPHFQDNPRISISFNLFWQNNTN